MFSDEKDCWLGSQVIISQSFIARIVGTLAADHPKQGKRSTNLSSADITQKQAMKCFYP